MAIDQFIEKVDHSKHGRQTNGSANSSAHILTSFLLARSLALATCCGTLTPSGGDNKRLQWSMRISVSAHSSKTINVIWLAHQHFMCRLAICHAPRPCRGVQPAGWQVSLSTTHTHTQKQMKILHAFNFAWKYAANVREGEKEAVRGG